MKMEKTLILCALLVVTLALFLKENIAEDVQEIEKRGESFFLVFFLKLFILIALLMSLAPILMKEMLSHQVILFNRIAILTAKVR